LARPRRQANGPGASRTKGFSRPAAIGT